MKKFALILVVLGLLLAACSTPQEQTVQATIEPSLAVVEASPEVFEPAAASTATMSPTSQPDQVQPTQGSNVVVYKLAPGESTASYEVGETFFNQNNRFALAIGITPQVNGEVQIDFSDPRNSKIGPIEIDVSQLKSDSSRRDNAIRDRFLESNSFPIVKFTPTTLVGLPESYAPGEVITFQVTGDLSIKETTLPVTFEVTARVEGDALIGTAATTILLSDFNAGPITTGVLQTEDDAKLTLSFVGRP